MTQSRVQFVEAIENGNFEEAMNILVEMNKSYHQQGGFENNEERMNFETIVKWFNKEVYEKGYVGGALHDQRGAN